MRLLTRVLLALSTLSLVLTVWIIDPPAAAKTTDDTSRTMPAPTTTTTTTPSPIEPLCDEQCIAWVNAYWFHKWMAWQIHVYPFLVCTRSHESSHTPPLYDNGYQAVSPSGTYRGAYQFHRGTWNNTATRAGRFDLVGVDPAAASVEDQDLLAYSLYTWAGAGPWLGRCA